MIVINNILIHMQQPIHMHSIRRECFATIAKEDSEFLDDEDSDFEVGSYC